jgi:hypothetical protein
MILQGPAGAFACIEANGSTAVKGSPGTLQAVVINTKGASSNVLKLYDGADNTGTLIATIDTTVDPGTFLYGLVFTAGLYAVLGTGTAAKLTIIFT